MNSNKTFVREITRGKSQNHSEKEYSEIQSDRITQGGTLEKSTLKFRVAESPKVLILK
jgi:hypothetical protein